MTNAYYKDKYGREFNPGKGLPTVSTDLDSVRTYQFEVQFTGLPSDVSNEGDLTLAAKKVVGLGMSNEPIVVDRVNDKLYYPGKVTPEEVTITFDNLYMKETANDLWEFFKTIYDPIAGEMTKNAQPGGAGTFKAKKVEIILLNNSLEPHSAIELYGVWPTKWNAAELNYATNDFHTIEVSFRYDFMNQTDV